MILCLIFAFFEAVPVSADDLGISTNDVTGWPACGQIYADYACLMDADTGEVLVNKSMDTQNAPASLTKIMTALLAVEHGNMDDQVTVDGNATAYVYPGSSSQNTQMGEVFTLKDLLYGTMLVSANDMATAVGVHIGGGSLDTFVKMMNDRAAELGCTGTHFENACGMPADGQLTTAHDLALISKAALSYDLFREIVSTASYTIPATNMSGPRVLTNHHQMVVNPSTYPCEGIIGGKTGYTDAAGHCLATWVERDGMTLIAVTLHSGGSKDLQDASTLIEYGYEHFKKVTVDTGDYLLSGDGTLVLPKEINPEDCVATEQVTDNGDGTEEVSRTYAVGGYELGSVSFTRAKAVSSAASDVSDDSTSGSDRENTETGSDAGPTESSGKTEGASLSESFISNENADSGSSHSTAAGGEGTVTVAGHSVSRTAASVITVLILLILAGAVLIAVALHRRKR